MHDLLTVEELTTSFSTGRGTVHAVNDVSFSIKAGETLGVVGESGSGKSVTFLSLLGLLPARGTSLAGRAHFEDTDLVRAAPGKLRSIRGNRVAMIFQDPMSSLNPVLTIGTQIEEVLRLHQGLTSSQAKDRARELLTLVNIPGSASRLKSYPHQLSGGMRQRVMIAIGLACQPDLLIADEPTTALDVTVQAQIVRLVKRLREESGMAVVWVTHDLALLAGIADRIQVMYAGRIVEDGPAQELYDAPRHPYTMGLLASMPTLDTRPGSRLYTVPGSPPDLVDYPRGCPFAARCPVAEPKCREQQPPLAEIGLRKRVACWVRPTPEQFSRATEQVAFAGGGVLS